jgi:hypothetical protein
MGSGRLKESLLLEILMMSLSPFLAFSLKGYCLLVRRGGIF